MTRSLQMIEARNRLTNLTEEFEREPESGAIAVTRRGKPVLAIMPWELYESIVETLEVLGDQKMMAALRQGVREATQGKGVPWEKARRKLRL